MNDKNSNINPLSGLRVPSLAAIAEHAVSMFGRRVIDLSHPLQREKLRLSIEVSLRCALDETLQSTLIQAQEKAMKHVFRLMQDPEYQHKRTERLKAYREQRKQRRAQTEAERAAEARAKMSTVKPVHGKVIIQ